jgi:hypothetical protein
MALSLKEGICYVTHWTACTILYKEYLWIVERIHVVFIKSHQMRIIKSHSG